MTSRYPIVDRMMHAVDWFPTVITAAGGKVTSELLDFVTLLFVLMLFGRGGHLA